MLCIPAGLIILAANNEPMRLFMTRHLVLFYVCLALELIMLLSLFCFTRTLKKVPQNYIYLFAFTCLESYTFTTFACFFKGKSIIYVAILTMVMVVTLTLYACLTETDFTDMWPLLWVSLSVSFASITLMVTVKNHYLLLIICWISLMVFALYLILDTECIMDDVRYGVTLDDYAICAMIVFVDILRVLFRIISAPSDRHPHNYHNIKHLRLP